MAVCRRIPESEALRLLRFLSIAALPTPLQDICDYLRINLIFMPSRTTTDAMYIHGPNGPAIIINDSKRVNRKRFSLAHELGHYILGHGPVSFFSETRRNRHRIQEVQANQFAAELLMPRPVLIRQKLVSPSEISKRCCVSFDSATIRAKQLGWILKSQT